MSVQLDNNYNPALMISGDGTAIKHLNYESKHISLQVPDYKSNGSPTSPNKGAPVTRFFGISSAPNHTSEMQLKGWKKVPIGSTTCANPVRFASYFLGLGSNHAEDQKKLAHLIEEWKKICVLQIHGERLMQGTAMIELLPILMEEKQHSIQEAGGSEAWEALPDSKKDHLDYETYVHKAWESLTAEEQHKVQLFIWAGCCMHKEMNSVKGRAQALAEYWKTAGVVGSVKLMN
ncbi:hypothetical protein L208DRAFT_1374203 [Tricholoma matsutake]|nr:hypothetical protein L208DRAFT_1374203 [Tricholoma matsutake 945]